MTTGLLDWFAARGGASLHAHGRSATKVLLGEIPAHQAGPILEIGCGTGETAVQLCRVANSVVAVDASPQMLKHARGRSKWCGVASRLQIVQVSADGSLPFASASFPTVVIESVLAIQNPRTLNRLVRECARVVKPQGRVVVNETVWITGTPRAVAREINRRAAASVGIIQASLSPFDAVEWRAMFDARGFRVLQWKPLDDVPLDLSPPPGNRSILLRSRIFTAARRVASLIKPGGLREHRRVMAALADLAPQQPCLEGILFVLEPNEVMDPAPSSDSLFGRP